MKLNYRLEGIVLKRINVSEADRVITLLSSSQGKIRVIAKGIRKLNSRRAPHLEIFSHLTLYVHESKFLLYVTEAELIDGFIQVRKNFRKVTIAYHLCEITDKLLPEKEKNAGVFESLLAALALLNNSTSLTETRQGVRVFVQNLLQKLGYINLNQKLTYSQLIVRIEEIIEKPLKTLRLLTKISK